MQGLPESALIVGALFQCDINYYGAGGQFVVLPALDLRLSGRLLD